MQPILNLPNLQRAYNGLIPEPIEQAIIPYNGLTVDPDVIHTVFALSRLQSALSSSEDTMGNMQSLPQEIILKIFSYTPIGETYKLTDQYKMKVIQKLAQGVPATIAEFSWHSFTKLGQDVSNLSRCCKTFYALTQEYRSVLKASRTIQMTNSVDQVLSTLGFFHERTNTLFARMPRFF